jgi:hypothetical protein
MERGADAFPAGHYGVQSSVSSEGSVLDAGSVSQPFRAGLTFGSRPYAPV